VSNVSITLQTVGDATAILDAIVNDNPAAIVHPMPSCVKIDCPNKLVINKGSVSERIGREWDVQEIHLSVITLAGNVTEEDDYFSLEWKR
jgi:phenol hydroxylase P2 protein